VTFSLLGLDPQTGSFGAVISSSSPAVAARCLTVRAAVGAAASQNITDPRLGPRLLDLLADGASPQQAIDEVVASTPEVGYRQLAAIDQQGRTAAYSGPHSLGTHAYAHGTSAVAAGNLLAHMSVPARMVEAFEESPGAKLGDRLIAALSAGRSAGGEEGPIHSAGLLVTGAAEWPITDLRVDWADDPIEELATLWRLWEPQSDNYLQRALDPSAAPAFGTPGDE
jgi:uncharacterized Ntn-hydrolase superfamily protein